MKKIALSLVVLGAAFAGPALANEATHNGLPVIQPSVETIRASNAQTDLGALTQGSFEIRSDDNHLGDAARGAKSGT
jgi:hypothetical protein